MSSDVQVQVLFPVPMLKMETRMSETYYRHCTYSLHQTAGGILMETAWLPEKLAVMGKKIYFGKKPQIPTKLWEIVSVGDHRLPESYVLDHQRDYKTQREASDIYFSGRSLSSLVRGHASYECAG